MSIVDPGGPLSGGAIIIDPNTSGVASEPPPSGGAVGPGYALIRDASLYACTMNDHAPYTCTMADELA